MSRTGPNNDAAVVRRLQTLDAMLASREGLHLNTAAEALGVCRRTLYRSLRLIAELGHATTFEPGSNVHRYSRGVSPIFMRTLNRGRRHE